MTNTLKPRAATAEDIEGIVALNVASFGAQDGPDVRAFLADPDVRAAWSVVADGSEVVSAIARIPHRFNLDGIELPIDQIEYVATDPAHQRQGLVAKQMAWHHAQSERSGVLLQLIGGIPYFYRRFGYGYGLDAPTLYLFDPDRVAAQRPREPITVRDAEPDDLDAILELEHGRPTRGLRIVRDARTWRRALDMCQPSAWAHLLVAERESQVLGWARVFDHPNERRTFLLPSVARTADAATELVCETLERAGDHLVIGFDSPASVFGDQLARLGDAFEYGLGYYARIADPIAFLELLRPVLTERLTESEHAGSAGTLEISLYSRGIAIDYERGVVGEIRPIAGVEDPTDADGIGVAPDWFPALVLGRWGARELARRVDDVIIARDHRLMDTLFPARRSDVAGDF